MRLSYRPLRSGREPSRRETGISAEVMAEKFRSIFEASPDYIIVARLDDGRIIEANEGFERLSGWARHEAIGHSVLELGLWEHPERRQELVRQLWRDGVVHNFPLVIHRRDHRLLHVLASLRIFALAGAPHYVAILRDVTDEERIRRALSASETRLRTIFEASPYAIVLNRVSDLTYVDVNPAYEKIFGFRAAEVIGKTVSQTGFVFRDFEAFKQQSARLLARGQIDNEEATVQRRDGRWITFIYSSRVVELEGEQVIVTVTVDVTQQKQIEESVRRAEEALRESEACFSTLFESSPIALAVFRDAAHDYVSLQFNEAWYKTFLYSPEQVIGKKTTDFGFQVTPADRPRIHAELERDGEVRAFECWLYREDGEKLLCSLYVRRLLVGNHRLVLAAYLDITHQRRTEEALHDLNASLEFRIQQRSLELQQAQAELMRSEKLAALGSLVAGVAHELNTPIGNSLMVASTLLDGSEKLQAGLSSGMRRSELENFLANVHAGGQILVRNLARSAELIQTFKTVAVDQSNNQRRIFDLAQIVAETLKMLDYSRKKSGILVDANIEEGLLMNSFPGQIEQVLINLVDNAVQHAFGERGNGQVHIAATALDGDRVRLTIADDGCGIPQENLKRVFDPFFTTRLGQGGSGLGLSIVLSIVENVLGGHIYAESRPGEGTRMCIDMPRKAPDSPVREWESQRSSTKA